MRRTQKFSLLLPSLAEPPQLFVRPPAKVSLKTSLSEPPQLFVRPPGKASVADYESWDIAALLFTMARSPVADHEVAQPELDVEPVGYFNPIPPGILIFRVVLRKIPQMMRRTQKFSLLLPSLAEPPQVFVRPPAKVSLKTSLSEPPQLFVRPPGKASVADYETWDIAVLLFTMARSPVADHEVAQPELDVEPCHDCISPKATQRTRLRSPIVERMVCKKDQLGLLSGAKAILPPLFSNLIARGHSRKPAPGLKRVPS